ncbi:hypothetical protein ACFQS6_04515 [Xanthomonas populi]
MPDLHNARGVYLITLDEPDTARLLARTLPLLPAVTWLQYRNKQATAARRLNRPARCARPALRTVCR